MGVECSPWLKAFCFVFFGYSSQTEVGRGLRGRENSEQKENPGEEQHRPASQARERQCASDRFLGGGGGGNEKMKVSQVVKALLLHALRFNSMVSFNAQLLG